MMLETLTLVVAAYAAIVSTGALALEVRRWFESGPSLDIKIMPKVSIEGSYLVSSEMAELVTSEEFYVAVFVANNGTQPTTISHLHTCERRASLFRPLRKSKPLGLAINPAVGGHAQLPVKLSPGEIWQGAIAYDEKLTQLALERKLIIGISATHRHHPYYVRV